ncbi:hypothetical protein [Halalkalibacter alkalisediminis]|uniref:Uncharacterized protein n=1 Tax=Halalkalibacter alkalisediminis TaxID=935616 RepID=A0ABV6NGA7_9BACI|nr:hypothetical protein [Halalkalibacter alkalisediminis]
MMELHNEQMKNNYEMQRNVMYNALINSKRGKNSRIIPLFTENDERTTLEIMDERKELFGDEILTR